MLREAGKELQNRLWLASLLICYYPRTIADAKVDYFNKRRVLEIRSSKTIEAAAKQREEAEKKGFK